MSIFAGKTLMITGGTGSFGNAVLNRNKSTLKTAMKGVDYIFHAAALKQVPSCEFFPMEENGQFHGTKICCTRYGNVQDV